MGKIHQGDCTVGDMGAAVGMAEGKAARACAALPRRGPTPGRYRTGSCSDHVCWGCDL